jgi:uncharacterized protein YjbI with pentapeptide repeats
MIKELDLNRFCSDGMFECLVDDHEKYLKTDGEEGERIVLRGVQIGGIWQSDIDLSHSTYTDCEFEGSPVDKVNFTSAFFKNCNFEETVFTDCNFDQARFINRVNAPIH